MPSVFKNEKEEGIWVNTVVAVLSGRDSVFVTGMDARTQTLRGVGAAAAAIADDVLEEFRKRQTRS